MNSSKKCVLLASLFAASAAHAEIVVIVNPKQAAALTPEQVANVYLGKDVSFAPADLPDSSPIRAQFYSKVAGKDAAQIKAIWARLVFTGKTQPPKELASPADVVKYVASNDKAIAYVDKSAVDASVKTVLSVA